MPVLAYGVAVTVLFTIGTAIVPVYAHGREFAGALNASGRGGGALRTARLRTVFAASEIVLAFAVLCIAVLLLQSFVRLERTPVGFREANVYAVQIDLPASAVREQSANPAILCSFRDSVRALPGVAGAAEALTAGLGSQSNTNYSLHQAF